MDFSALLSGLGSFAGGVSQGLDAYQRHDLLKQQFQAQKEQAAQQMLLARQDAERRELEFRHRQQQLWPLDEMARKAQSAMEQPATEADISQFQLEYPNETERAASMRGMLYPGAYAAGAGAGALGMGAGAMSDPIAALLAGMGGGAPLAPPSPPPVGLTRGGVQAVGKAAGAEAKAQGILDLANLRGEYGLRKQSIANEGKKEQGAGKEFHYEQQRKLNEVKGRLGALRADISKYQHEGVLDAEARASLTSKFGIPIRSIEDLNQEKSDLEALAARLGGVEEGDTAALRSIYDEYMKRVVPAPGAAAPKKKWDIPAPQLSFSR